MDTILNIAGPYIGVLTGCILALFLIRVKWCYLALFLLFIFGCALCALAGYFAGYPIISALRTDSWWYLLSAASGMMIWVFLCMRIFAQHRLSCRNL